MKNLTYILALLVLPFCAVAQNLVPNGNFEDYTQCPYTISQINYATGWSSLISNTTPDYFSSCTPSLSTTVSVPNNILGYQQPASGNRYAGLIPYSNDMNQTNYNEYREIITHGIIPLTPGMSYEVSLSISLANNAKYATSNIDVFFYDTITTTLTHNLLGGSSNYLGLQPQVTFADSGVITDTLNWVRLVGTFTPDSAYDHIAIGGFKTTANIDTTLLRNRGLNYTYYYIDSVVVRLAPQLFTVAIDSMLCGNDTATVTYTTIRKFDTGNTFTIQLSDANGNFNTPTTIGVQSSDTGGTVNCYIPNSLNTGTGYKLKIIGSSPADTLISSIASIDIGNLDSANIILSSNSPVCSDDDIIFNSSSNSTAVNYNWQGPNNFSSNATTPSITNSSTANSGSYYVQSQLYGCIQKDTLQVTVYQKPLQPSISFNTPLCAGETLNLTASGSSNYSYQWYGPSSFSANAKNTTRSNAQTNYSGVYKVTAIENGCVSDTGFASITINPLPFAVITSNPADSICMGQLASFTALPGNAGSSPQYNWYVNTQLVGSGITYNTTTLNNQDVVYCEMTDNTKCSVPYTDQSNFLTMTVLPWLAPSVTISVSPTGPVQSGTFLTFTATATNAGNKPQYQWKRNGKDIVGAMGSSWGALSLNNNDTITVEIISDYRCPQPTNAVSNKIVTQIEGVGINEIAVLTDLTLAPNPNRAQFVLSGQLNHQGMVHISVMNMLGQTIYRTDSEVINNQLHQEIVLPQVTSGMYLLQLEANGQRMNRKFRVE